jgi:putative phosphonate metabolism protein
MRVAIFFAPAAGDPLGRAASEWLGRDAHSGETLRQPAVEGFAPEEISDLTADPRRYGFHATLKPPFRLATGRSLATLRGAVEAFCDGMRPVRIGALRIERLGPFFAMTPDGPTPELAELAGTVVRAFDPWRAPPSEEEIARRRPERLTHRQRENLRRWGYPYVFEDFRFHMTLTGPVPAEQRDAMKKALGGRFARFLGQPLAVDALSLFIETSPPGDFMVETRLPLAPATEPLDVA